MEKTEPAGNPELAADGNKALAQALHRLSEAVGELHEFAKALCEGHLDAVSPSRENALCWELKALRSHLSHLNWQMQAVSQGDYSQHIDFLGDYSITFNAMNSTAQGSGGSPEGGQAPSGETDKGIDGTAKPAAVYHGPGTSGDTGLGGGDGIGAVLPMRP